MKYLFSNRVGNHNLRLFHGVECRDPDPSRLADTKKEILAVNAAVKRLDVICIGRVAESAPTRLVSQPEDVASFAKYLGGSLRQRGLWHRDSGAEIGHTGARWR